MNELRNTMCRRGLLALLLTGLGVASCGGNHAGGTPATPSAQAKALEDTLLNHHDRVMAELPRLFALKTQLTAAKVPAQAPVLRQMQAADQAMMDWMHHYQAPDSATPAAQRLTYLQAQHRQLRAVEQQVAVALDSGQAALRRAGR